jgi:predicted amidohydrolase
MGAMVSDIDADVIVYPELCTSGYLFESRDELDLLAEEADGHSFQFLRQLADDHQAVIVAGFAEKADAAFYNSCLIVIPGEDKPVVYRKTHLFYKESLFFEPGDSGFFVVPIVSMDVTVGPMVCYDWRFPESARILTLLGADIIACPANLVTEAWKVVMPARALENHVYLAVANRAGRETRGQDQLVFKGESTIYDFNGRALRSAGRTEDSVLTATIYPERTRDKSFNPFNHILKDRKPHHYSTLTA